jgi:hypothetical protein
VQFTPRQEAAIDNAQRALRETLKKAYPEPTDFVVLYLAAVTSAFTAVVRGELAPRLMAIVNGELKPANLTLSRARGFGALNHPGAARKRVNKAESG